MLVLAVAFATAASNIITLNPTITYQSINGWEVVTYAAFHDSAAFPNYISQVLDGAANDIGINRLRLEVRSGTENSQDYYLQSLSGQINYSLWRCLRYSTVNDNNDPNSINWNGFQFSDFDEKIDNVVLPLKQRIEANGEKLYVNLLYVAFTNQIRQAGCPSGLQYIHNNPDEYAELILATFLHLKNKYSLVPDSLEIILEPDNVPEFNSGVIIGNAIVKTKAKLRANGFDPEIIAPSAMNMGVSVSRFDEMLQVPGAIQNLSEISYHRYSGATDANLQAISSRAVQYGKNTSMLEWWDSANGYQTLHKDLKMGRNSAWEQGVLVGLAVYNPSDSLYLVDDQDPANPIVTINTKTKFYRQYFKYIRSGAIRIDANTNNAAFDPLAFINADGKFVVVVKADASGSFSIQGLPTGSYGIKYTTASQYNIDLADANIGANEMLNASIPAIGVITIYAKSTSPRACTENDWTYTDGACQINNTLTRTWTKSNIDCQGGVSHPTTEAVNCTYTPPNIPGDINNDGKVDVQDLIIVTQDFGKTSGLNNPKSDTNGDNIVDIFDIVYVASRFT